MNLDQIKEIRTVSGEVDINKLLSAGNWRIIELQCNDGYTTATMVRIRS